jgi:hypothetical protein
VGDVEIAPDPSGGGEAGTGADAHSEFHDVATGSNDVAAGSGAVTGYQAGPGWDPVTGWGSPNAQVLVPLLARFASSTGA